MNFLQICLKFFISFSFLSKEILHELKKYELNMNFWKKCEKIIFVSIKSLDPDLDPDQYIKKRGGTSSVY